MNYEFEPAYADLKGTEDAEKMRNFAIEAMKDADKAVKKPLYGCSYLFPEREIPEEIVNIANRVKGPNTTTDHAIALLVWDTWQHIDDDINDLYTYHFKAPYGFKNITYKNEHPTIEMIEKMRKGFKDFYLNELAEGADEKHICELIALEVADYCMGSDFKIIFGEDLDKLHSDMKEAFLEDARRILNELKNSIQ